ncbi:MAG TPA: AsmA-like C-terminal region-containing protein, partial [Trinickia sp.]|nr:AsmA-like C-terminal region-containing protein [Trinickia sp.]
DPGAAKLLGVLSMQSLARVLTLNFKDVIGEGLPFESATGTARIEDGIGRTDDFRIVTAPARADISGTVDLAAETQGLNVEVTPTLSVGSAVIAATIVNPLFGLGALVANVALSQSIAHAFAKQYAITGSWSHPHVERVSGDRGKMSAPTEATGK